MKRKLKKSPLSLLNYILDKHGNPVYEPSLMMWCNWMADHQRDIHWKTKVGKREVSTVFLGLDHNFRGDGPPILWETMVFGPGRNEEMTDRCSGSREQAEAMHQQMVKRLRKEAK